MEDERDSPEQQEEQAPSLLLACGAVGGIALGGLVLIALVAAATIPGVVAARQEGNEAAAVGALKTITMAEVLFREADKDANGVLDYGTLADLARFRLVDSVLGAGTKQGYAFEVQLGEDPTLEWWATATPLQLGKTGERFFYADAAGLIYESLDEIQGPLDPQALPPGVTALKKFGARGR